MDDLLPTAPFAGAGARYYARLQADVEEQRMARLAALCSDRPMPAIPEPPVGAPSMPGGGRGWPTSVCKWCRARIIWAITVRGKSMPVDPVGTNDGNVRLLSVDGEVHAYVLGPLEAFEAVMAGEQLRWPHHATCPDWPNRQSDGHGHQRVVR